MLPDNAAVRFRMIGFRPGVCNRDISKENNLCLPKELVCSCVDLTYTNVNWSLLSLRRPDVSLVFCRYTSLMMLRKKIAATICCIHKVRTSLCLTL
jgi:hypothetical protein